jgi:hypothetical protein
VESPEQQHVGTPMSSAMVPRCTNGTKLRRHGPQPHPNFIEVFRQATFDDGDGTLEGAGENRAPVIDALVAIMPRCGHSQASGPVWEAFVNTASNYRGRMFVRRAVCCSSYLS